MRYELADIINNHIHELKLTPHQFKVLSNIKRCRTKDLGEHKLKCKKCGHEEYSYNSCRDRHCPKCLGSKQVKWKLERSKELLPVNYRHLIFKIPPYLKELFLYNKLLCYKILFKAVNWMFKELSEETGYLLGYILMLHTWSQLLNYHTHIHCLIPEGKINTKTKKWIPEKFINVEYMNILFRKILSQLIVKEFDKGKIKYPGLTRDELQRVLLKPKRLIYMEKSKSGFDTVNYLGNFTNRVAITNNRIVGYDGTDVTISYVDRKHGNIEKLEKLPAGLFLKRFCFHILPNKLAKVRYYGFLSNNNKKKYIGWYQMILSEFRNKVENEVRNKIVQLQDYIYQAYKCPVCKRGEMEYIELLSFRNST